MWASRLATIRLARTRLVCRGTKRGPPPQVSQWPSAQGQRRHTALYVMSLRPPGSRGGAHSRVTDVPFTLEIRFTGAEGGPGEQRVTGGSGGHLSGLVQPQPPIRPGEGWDSPVIFSGVPQG